MSTSTLLENKTTTTAGMSGSKRRSRLVGIIETNLPSTVTGGSHLVTLSNRHYQNVHDFSVIVNDLEEKTKGDTGENVFPPLIGAQANVGRNLSDCCDFDGVVGVDGALTGVNDGSRVARRDSNLHDDFVIAEPSIASAFAKDVTGKFSTEDAFAALCTSKKYLNMRTVEDWSKFSRKLDRRREWNQWRPTDTLLDYFTSVKYSHSSLLPEAHRKGFTSINVNENGKVRVAKIARSHSIRLDPVDAPKELYKHRLRIDLILDWAYKAELVPVMMTLTVYHRWHALEPLCKVLQESWAQLFVNGRQGEERKNRIDLQGYVRRMEETINDNDAEFNIGNNGWHPHYHVILLIPRKKVATLSKYETELKEIWVKLVRSNFHKVFGEEIPAAYIPALRKHGLVISRYSSGMKKGRIRPVQDSKYLAKIMGYDPAKVYGGDKEMTAYNLKNSKIPFDLLMGKITANKCDLWCEYAIATKGIPSFKYSKGLERRVHEYFKANPGKINPDYAKPLNLEFAGWEAPKEKVISNISKEALKFVHGIKRDQEMHDVARGGYEALEAWITALAKQYGAYLGLGVWKPLDADIDDDDDENSAAVTGTGETASMSMSGMFGEFDVPFDELVEDPYQDSDDAGEETRRISPVEVYENLSAKEKILLSMKEDLTFEECLERGIVKYREEPASEPEPAPAAPPQSVSSKPSAPPKPPAKAVFDEELELANLSEDQINEMLAEGIPLNPVEREKYLFRKKRKMRKMTSKTTTAPPPLPRPPTKPSPPTMSAEEQCKTSETLQAFLKSHSSVSPLPAQNLEKASEADQGISAPILQAQEPAVTAPPSTPPENSEAELKLAAKLDKPGILPSHIKFTPLVSQGRSVNEALEELSLTPSEKETIFGLIQIFRKQISATSEPQTVTRHEVDAPHIDYRAERAAKRKKTPARFADDDSAKVLRLAEQIRQLEDLHIPEEQKAAMRDWLRIYKP